MKEFTGTYQVYSPRWGHNDTYLLKLTRTEMEITLGAGVARSATCTLVPDDDAVWTGYGHCVGTPLMSIFQNDGIYVSHAIPRILERAWEKWREGTPDEVIREGMQEMFDWISSTAMNKPKSELWIGNF